MEMKDEYACYLDMKEGLNGIKYNQNFVRASKSAHPSPAPSQGKEMPHSEAMRITMGK